jgi:hypothetical protein
MKRVIFILFISGFALSLRGFEEARGQVQEAWVARYDGLHPGAEAGAYGLAVDEAGNSFVTGQSHMTTGGNAIVTIRYSKSGNMVWMDPYYAHPSDGACGKAVALDNFGNVFVAGYSDSVHGGYGNDFCLIKYDYDGNQQWRRRYDGYGQNDFAEDMAIDDDGNVYVTGYGYGANSDLNYITLKYSNNGNLLWASTYNGIGGGHDRVYEIVLDDHDDVCVTGYSYGTGTETDFATVKYNGDNGDELWVARYDGIAGDEDCGAAIGKDSEANIYVTGYTTVDADSHDLDYCTIKYDSDGNQLWVATYDGPNTYFSADYAWDTMIDGNVIYVTGQSRGDGTWDDYVTVKYDSHGNELWVRRYDGPVSYEDVAGVITTDIKGDIYISGTSFGPSLSRDCLTVKYDSDGNLKWTARYDGTANDNEWANEIVVDEEGNVFLSGISTGLWTNGDFITIKYRQNPLIHREAVKWR